MRSCNNCKVTYDTPLKHCIFCESELSINELDRSTYKFTPFQKRGSWVFFYRLFLFINLLSAGVALYVDYTSGASLSWSLVVAISNLYAVVLCTILYVPTVWTSKVTKGMVVSIMAALFIGLAIRDHRWALDFVFPLGVMANTLLLSILLLANRSRWFDHAVSLFGICLFGLIPGVLNFFGSIGTHWPSIACFVYAIATLLGMVVLSTKESREEFKRRFHF